MPADSAATVTTNRWVWTPLHAAGAQLAAAERLSAMQHAPVSPPQAPRPAPVVEAQVHMLRQLRVSAGL